MRTKFQILKIIIDDFTIISYFGMGLLHVKREKVSDNEIFS